MFLLSWNFSFQGAISMTTPLPQSEYQELSCGQCQAGEGLDFDFSFAFQPIVDVEQQRDVGDRGAEVDRHRRQADGEQDEGLPWHVALRGVDSVNMSMEGAC